MTTARTSGDPREFVYTQTLKPLGSVLITLLVLQLIGNAVLIVGARREMRIIDELRTDLGSVSQDDVDAADRLIGTTSFLLILLYLLTAAVFVVWLYRARRNVEQWAPVYQRRGQGWAIGGWLCPILNLWVPYQLARDVWDDTERRADDAPRPRRPLLAAWWFSYLVGAPLAVVAVLVGSGDNESRDDYSSATLAAVITMLSALLAIAVVQSMTAAQTRRRARAYIAIRR